jgi:hypothetical protein
MLGLVYLARATEGLAPVKRFAESYQTHASGADHSLVVICKGHRSDSEIDETRRQFGQPVEIISVSDDGFDIGAYINAAQTLKYERLCFLNTFTEIAADNWLGILDRQLSQPGTGIAGATGSFESVRTTIDFVAKAAWLCLVQRLPYDPDLANQFQWVFELYAQPWLQRRGWQKRALDRLRVRGSGRLASGTPSIWREHWKAVTGYAGDLSAWLDGFPEFPNPHIRSNGFAVRREIFNRIVSECQPTKESAMHFESGADGYTAKIRQLGQKAEVVDKDGTGYDVSEWPKSRTFRLGDQRGLILTDNQSRNFEAMSSGTKATHARVTWGDYAAPAPDWFRDLGFSFMKGAQASAHLPKA